MTSGADWRGTVGRSWAVSYARTDRSFTGLTEQLLARIGGHAGERVLDVGCGAGELSLAVARGRSRTQVVGLDLSPHLISAAQARAGQRSDVRFEVGDAAKWSEPDFTPDLIVSRHGVMFFDDPPGAFAHLHGIASDEAHVVFSCFRNPRENRWASDVAAVFDLPPAPPEAPGPFAFADPQRVEAILAAAGWGKIDFEPVDFAFIAGAGEDPVADALDYFTRIGPAASTLAALEGDEHAAKEADLTRVIEQHLSDGLVAFAAAAWIVTASADRRHRAR